MGAFVLASTLHYAGTPAKFQQASGRGAARCAPVRHDVKSNRILECGSCYCFHTHNITQAREERLAGLP